MFETRSLAVDIESKLNALAEELKTQCRFKITDNVQDYESYIKLINNDEEFNYIPGVLEVISPIVPSTRVGVYTATYKLSLYIYYFILIFGIERAVGIKHNTVRIYNNCSACFIGCLCIDYVL